MLTREAFPCPHLGRTPDFSMEARTRADEASVSPHCLTVSEGTEAAALQGEGSRRLLGAPLCWGLWEAAPVTFLMIFRP